MSSNYPPNYPPNMPPQRPPQMPPNMPPHMPPNMNAPVTPKKSFPWLWLLAGCGTLLVISIIAIAGLAYIGYRKAKQAGLDPALMQKNPALASAKMVIGMNPDLEIINTDEDNGTITIRDKKSGKTITANMQDIKNGNISFKGDKEDENVSLQTNTNSGSFEIKTDKETVKFGGGSGSANLPDWLPAYPGATFDGVASMNSGKEQAGTVHFLTQDTVDDVLNFYEDELKAKGLNVRTNTAKSDGEIKSGQTTATDTGDKRSANVTATSSAKGTDVYLTYRAQK